jgi:predicted TIM-barrel fold metal-dependent hydrolase
MKIINAHCHLIEVEKALGDKELLQVLQSIPTFKDVDKSIALISEQVILQQMVNANIAQTVLFACDCPIVYASNEFASNVCKKYPDKFIGFASVKPTEEEAPEILQHAIRGLHLKGLKLHPPLQNFYPNDKRIWPVYEMADYLGIPVVFHVGSTPFGQLVRLDQAYPVLIDEVACNFPRLKIILTHLGTLWHHETFMVAEKNTNVFIDTAAYPYEIKELINTNLLNRVGPHKFIFGTDFPMPYENKEHTMLDFVHCISGLRIPDAYKEGIFFRNFENLMGINS